MIFVSKIDNNFYSRNNLEKRKSIYFLKATKLFNKYLKVKSELEINISSQKRQYLTNYFENTNNINYSQLYNIFDGPINSMWYLMRDSFTRFLRSPEFSKNESIFVNKTKI